FPSGRHELWLLDLDGRDEPRLLTRAGVEASYEGPEWSPDGGFIYCLSDLDREMAAPARIDVSSGELSYVVEPDVEVDEATLEPTGLRLAYALNHDGEAEIVIRTLSTGAEESVRGLPAGALY